MPHDAGNQTFVGSTRQRLKDLRLPGQVRVGHKVDDKANALEAARMVLPTCRFDAQGCDQGLKRLRNYRKEWDTKRGAWKPIPLHDENSHGADAFMEFATNFQPRSRHRRMKYRTDKMLCLRLPTAPLTDNELVSILEQHRAASVTFFDDEIAQEQRESLDYYEGRPFGDETVGRSQVVSRDVAEVVDWMMPDVLEIFAGDEDAVEFKARQDGPGPAEIARRATECIRHTFWVDNDGMRILHDWVKDSLIQKNGWIKVWWDESEQEIRQTVTNQSPLQIQLFEDDDTVEVVDSEETEIPNFEELARRDPNLTALFPDGLSMTATVVPQSPGRPDSDTPRYRPKTS